MNVVIVYDSSTGTTAKAAEAMGRIMEQHGHTCRVQSVAVARTAEVTEADLVCLGAWVKGLFVVMQHPSEGALRFVNRLDNLAGKQAVVFCTYKLATGSTLPKMANALEEKGANVVGQFKFRGPEPNKAFAAFVSSLNQ